MKLKIQTSTNLFTHLFEQLVLQLQVNGKQYAIKDPAMQSSCGTAPMKLFEYKNIPESAKKIEIVLGHPSQQEKHPD